MEHAPIGSPVGDSTDKTADPLAWLGEVLGAMTPGPLYVHDIDGDPTVWTMPDAPPEVVDDEELTRWVESGDLVASVGMLARGRADACGLAALRNLAPAMLAVVKAAQASSEEIRGWDDLVPVERALVDALDAFDAAVREEQERHG